MNSDTNNINTDNQPCRLIGGSPLLVLSGITSLLLLLLLGLVRGGIPDNRDVSLSPARAFGIVGVGVVVVVVVAEGFDAKPKLAVGANAAVGLAERDAVGFARHVVHVVHVFRRKGDDVVGNLRVVLHQGIIYVFRCVLC